MSASHSYEATLIRSCGMLVALDRSSPDWGFRLSIDTGCVAGCKLAEGDKVKVTIEKVEE